MFSGKLKSSRNYYISLAVRTGLHEVQIKTNECKTRKQIILIYRVEIAVPIKDRLCLCPR